MKNVRTGNYLFYCTQYLLRTGIYGTCFLQKEGLRKPDFRQLVFIFYCCYWHRLYNALNCTTLYFTFLFKK
jgi:hypothetical protein